MARWRSRTSIAAWTAAVLMLAAGCGGSDQRERPAPEQRSIAVGVPASIAAVPVHIGLDRGIFAEYGLTVEIVEVEPRQAIRALVEGEVDIVLAEYPAIFRTQADGQDIRIIDEAYQAAPGVLAVVVPQDSAIVTPTDLSGKTIAVDDVNGLGWNTVRAMLEARAIPTDLRPQAVPVGDIADALSNGSVDAAWLQEPYISAAEQGDPEQEADGVRRVLDTASGPLSDLPISGYAATARWATSVPRTVEAFRSAIRDAKGVANTDRAVVEQILVERAGVSEQTATIARIGRFPTTMVPNRLQRVADLIGLNNLVVEVYTRLTPPAEEDAGDS